MHRYGLIGRNIDYSFSPGYFREKFNRLQLTDCHYETFDLPRISDLPDLLAEYPDLKGLNVTIPYKESVIPILKTLDETALQIGAVNTIQFTKEGLKGYNTDSIGFTESLKPLLRDSDRNALILGTGGASKAVAYSMGQLGIKHCYVSRNPGPGQRSYEALDAGLLAENQVIVNCTPLGTFPRVEQAPELPYSALNGSHLLYDLIYNPEETTFLSKGKKQGARIKNGLEMLQLQAEASWEIWNRASDSR